MDWILSLLVDFAPDKYRLPILRTFFVMVVLAVIVISYLHLTGHKGLVSLS